MNEKQENFIKYLRKLITKVEDGQAWFDTLGTEVITNTVSYDGFTLSQRPTGYRKTTLVFGEADE